MNLKMAKPGRLELLSLLLKEGLLSESFCLEQRSPSKLGDLAALKILEKARVLEYKERLEIPDRLADRINQDRIAKEKAKNL